MIRGLHKYACALATAATLSGIFTATANAKDWEQWGRDESRNMVAPEGKLKLDFNPGHLKDDRVTLDTTKAKHLKWVAKMGSETYGNMTVARGQVLVGTNNQHPRDAKHKGDRGVVLALDEKTGDMQWQLVVPKLGAGKVSDWEYLGICSSPLIGPDAVYVITNRCEVVALDPKGFTNGNQGVKDEGKAMSGPGKPAMAIGNTDADVLWRFDMREELGVFPHNIASSSAMLVGNRLYVTTSNGQDWSHVNIPAPNAPCLIALDAKTGELIGEEAAEISTRLYHCNWASPAYFTSKKGDQIIFGAGDGQLYGFDPKPEKDEDGFGIFKKLWQVDLNPKEYKVDANGKTIKYPATHGPSEIIATPVVYDGLIYTATGQDPEHGMGVGNLVCVDPATGKALWRNKSIERSISTVAAKDGLVYCADYTGFLHCVDAKTGKTYWKHDTQSNIWSSPLVVGDHVMIGNEDGLLVILKAGKDKSVAKEIEFHNAIYASPIFANNTLYIATRTHLFAFDAQP